MQKAGENGLDWKEEFLPETITNLVNNCRRFAKRDNNFNCDQKLGLFCMQNHPPLVYQDIGQSLVFRYNDCKLHYSIVKCKMIYRSIALYSIV